MLVLQLQGAKLELEKERQKWERVCEWIDSRSFYYYCLAYSGWCRVPKTHTRTFTVRIIIHNNIIFRIAPLSFFMRIEYMNYYYGFGEKKRNKEKSNISAKPNKTSSAIATATIIKKATARTEWHAVEILLAKRLLEVAYNNIPKVLLKSCKPQNHEASIERI